MSREVMAEGVPVSTAPAARPYLGYDRRLVYLLLAHALWPLVMPVAYKLAVPILHSAVPSLSMDILRSIGLITVYQVYLVAIWAGLGPISLRRRVQSLVLGTGYVVVVGYLLSGLLGRGPSDLLAHVLTVWAWYLLLATICAVILLLVRRTLFELRRVPAPELVDGSYRSGLRTRHLLLITFAIALLLAGSRLEDRIWRWWPIVMMAALVAAAAFAAIWATLAPGRPWGRVLLAIACAAGAAMLIAVQFEINFLEAFSLLPGFLVLVASLLVVRSARYRLIRVAPIRGHASR